MEVNATRTRAGLPLSRISRLRSQSSSEAFRLQFFPATVFDSPAKVQLRHRVL